MEHPRADWTAANAFSESHPSRTNTDTASIEERPILARQCTPSDRPALTISARCSTERKKPSLSDGTERSGIGRFTNSIAAASHSSDSRRSPSSLVSSAVSMETRILIPSCESALNSPQSQSPPRGRATIAMRLGRSFFDGIYSCFHLFSLSRAERGNLIARINCTLLAASPHGDLFEENRHYWHLHHRAFAPFPSCTPSYPSKYRQSLDCL